jgi:uncharacterized protein (DUF305 family)
MMTATGPEAAKVKARADSTRWPYTAADIRFMSTMIHHHAQAIVMAKMASTHGASESVQRLCQRIINAQTDEIAMMTRWLQDRNQPVPEPNPAGETMQMGGTTHTMLMPGMLTEEQMKQLEAARGPEFDRLFLTFMIQHHRGAVTMVQELVSNRGAANDETVFKVRRDVNVDQTTEINRIARDVARGALTSPWDLAPFFLHPEELYMRTSPSLAVRLGRFAGIVWASRTCGGSNNRPRSRRP